MTDGCAQKNCPTQQCCVGQYRLFSDQASAAVMMAME